MNNFQLVTEQTIGKIGKKLISIAQERKLILNFRKITKKFKIMTYTI
jgi:hypothetical protein